MSRPPIATALLLLTSTLAGQGYEWDHPDGVGVRYLLYKKLGRANIDPARFPSQLRAAYTPKDDKDYIRVRGYPMAWGLYVYEFAANAKDGAKDAADFLHNHDPRRRTREFTMDGEPLPKSDAGGQYWEFTDRFQRYVVTAKSPRPPGGLRWGECSSLGVRFLIERSMGTASPRNKAHGRAQMLPATSQWLRFKGRKKPVSWSVTLSEFGPVPRPEADPKTGRRPVWAESFAKYLEKTGKKLSVQGEDVRGTPIPAKLYEYRLDYRSNPNGLVMHHIAVTYQLADREVVLDARVPATGDKPDAKLWRLARKIVTSLEPWTPSPAKSKRGQYTYSVASAHTVGDKQVAMVVFIPIASGSKPTAAQIRMARKMVTSIEPAK